MAKSFEEQVAERLATLERRVGRLEIPKATAIFSVFLSANVTNFSGDGTAHTVVADTKILDRYGNYNTSTGVFTAPVVGQYVFDYNVYVSAVGASHTQFRVHFLATSGTYYLVDVNASSVRQGNQIIWNGSKQIDMAQGDTLSMVVTLAGDTKTCTLIGGLRYTTLAGRLLT